MKNIRVTNMIKVISMLWRVLITAAASAIFYNAYLTFYDEASFFYKGNILVLGLYVVSLVLFISMYGGFKLRYRPWRDLLFSYSFGILVTNAIIYLVLSLIASGLLNPVPIVAVVVLLRE